MEAKFGPLTKGGGGTRLILFEIKFFKITVGYTLFDHKMYENVLEDLKLETVHEKLRRYK